MTSDCYAILGVTPTAEDVVIHAAYRALMRHYHPDSNPDPDAQARAQAITAAYAVLRDPARRAEYDAVRAGGGESGGWFTEDAPSPPPPPPAMRGVGIAAAVLAVAMVGFVWAWPRSDPPRAAQNPPATTATKDGLSGPARSNTDPIIELKPEGERLADLHQQAQPPMPPPAIPVDSLTDRPQLVPSPAPPPSGPPLKRLASSGRAPTPKAPPARPLTDKPGSPADDRLATLERMSAGFFDQSMDHADAARKALLVAARDRFAAQRKACRSQACVAEGYVRQIRETGLIMEGRSQAAK